MISSEGTNGLVLFFTFCDVTSVWDHFIFGSPSGQHFVDKHMTELIQRVSNLDSILDELLSRKVIHGETYDKIRAVPVRQDKMREIYRTALQGGTDCKDIFYQILEEQQPYLVQDLKEGK